jgi:hypothetical protein
MASGCLVTDWDHRHILLGTGIGCSEKLRLGKCRVSGVSLTTTLLSGAGTSRLELLPVDSHSDLRPLDSNRKILEEVKKYALEHEARYGRLCQSSMPRVNEEISANDFWNASVLLLSRSVQNSNVLAM